MKEPIQIDDEGVEGLEDTPVDDGMVISKTRTKPHRSAVGLYDKRLSIRMAPNFSIDSSLLLAVHTFRY